LSGTKPKAMPVQVCWDCGAANHIDDRKCWRCGRPDWKSEAVFPTTVTVAETTDRAGLKSSLPRNRKNPWFLWVGLLLLWLPITIVLSSAIGEVWARFVDKPGIRREQSIKVLVIPFILYPAISGLYLIALAALYVYRVHLRNS
jgi:hypothetical protein